MHCGHSLEKINFALEISGIVFTPLKPSLRNYGEKIETASDYQKRYSMAPSLEQNVTKN